MSILPVRFYVNNPIFLFLNSIKLKCSITGIILLLQQISYHDFRSIHCGHVEHFSFWGGESRTTICDFERSQPLLSFCGLFFRQRTGFSRDAIFSRFHQPTLSAMEILQKISDFRSETCKNGCWQECTEIWLLGSFDFCNDANPWYWRLCRNYCCFPFWF